MQGRRAGEDLEGRRGSGPAGRRSAGSWCGVCAGVGAGGEEGVLGRVCVEVKKAFILGRVVE